MAVGAAHGPQAVLGFYAAHGLHAADGRRAVHDGTIVGLLEHYGADSDSRSISPCLCNFFLIQCAL